MISLSLRPRVRNWSTVSFPSTLHLQPILDLLLTHVPHRLHDPLRLGLQEALVNAAKHGNGLDPNKVILIRFSCTQRGYWWIISDQGQGFNIPRAGCSDPDEQANCPDRECGRGLFILHQIFDEVRWNDSGTELTLHKQMAFPKYAMLS